MQLRIQSPYSDEWTHLSIEGEEELTAVNVLATRLLALEYEVEVLEEGDWTSFEEVEW
jgi:hypothetical protein